ncbi:hypothetical protein B0H19DRAFT_1172669 [Mycena capillaripes]|nr:hypothetical protein B0H19DRAFT_1172669 [Mycena capillaripes]
MADPVLSEPRLPPELECIIFEIAALSHPAAIPKLMLIAGRVKHWVEPLLYSVVFLPFDRRKRSDRRVYGFPNVPVDILLTAIENKPPVLLESAVRHLFLDTTSSDLLPSAVNTILAACHHVTNLFVRPEPPTDLSMLGRLLCLQRLAIDISEYFPGTIDLAVFRDITHLDILDSRPRIHDIWTALTPLPRLTHISFNTLSFQTISPSMMRANTQLHCIVLLWRLEDSTMMSLRPHSEDARFVCIDQNNWREDWLRGAHTGEDYWALADAFIAAKHQGKVEQSRFSIRDLDDSWRTR